MNGTTTTRSERRPDAVVWIDEWHAIVAALDPTGQIATVEVRRLQRPESRYLADVVHEIGGHEHVMVVGPQPVRVALERRYVAVSHRPDRLMATPPIARAAGATIVTGIDSLAA